MLAEQSRHLNDGGVEDIEDELRIDADREHQQRGRDDDEFFVADEVGETAATFGERPAEEGLHHAHESHGREKQAEDCNRSKRSGDGECAGGRDFSWRSQFRLRQKLQLRQVVELLSTRRTRL